MASALTHAVVATSVGAVLQVPKVPLRIWLLGMMSSIVPDVDVIGFWFGVPYEHVLGHRGLTHSIAFAALWSTLIVAGVFHRADWKTLRRKLFLFFFMATALHGVLDAMTNGGLGVAFFAPLDNSRYFLPFRPIEVSPISVTGFFNTRGLAILASECLWIWLPCLILMGGVWKTRMWLGRVKHRDT